MQRYLDYDVKGIFDEFQKAYFDSRGELIKVGSEEFAITSVFTYALASVIGNMNRVALNRFVDGANGVSLDYIAQSFGLSRHKDPILNSRFAVGVYQLITLNLLPSSVEIDGITYANREDHSIGENIWLVIYKSEQSLSRPAMDSEGIKAELVKNMPSSLHSRVEVYGSEYPDGLLLSDDGTPMAFPYTFEGDNAFREYIKRHSNIISGTAAYYESMLSDLHPAIKQVYCIRQYDPGYLTGFAKVVYMLNKTNETTFANQGNLTFKISMNSVNALIVEDLLKDFRDDGRYHALGSDFRFMISAEKIVYPHIEAVYKNVNDVFIDGSFDWFSSGVHKHTWTPSQCHYMVINLYYSYALGKIGKKFNTSELSALLLKPLYEIDGLEDWCNNTAMFNNPEVLPAMYRNALSVKASLTYRVALNNLNVTIVDAEIAPDEAYQVLHGSLETSPDTGRRAIEIALVKHS